jgi:NAD(P)H-nitrite reductase large subunit
LAALTGQVTRAVVAGGGLVGLKAAYALKRAGVAEVTVVAASPRLLIRQLDEQAAAIVEAELAGMGLNFVYNAAISSLASDSAGRLTTVLLDDGRTLPAGLLLVAKGVRPNSELLAAAGGRVGRGIRVDDYLGTSLEDVYAAGDCIEVKDRWSDGKVCAGLWPLAFEQGRLAAANMLGGKVAYPAPLTRLNSARFGSVDVVAVGSPDGPETVKGYERGTYRRLVFDGERLAGYILAGRVDGAGVYTALVKSGRPARRYQRELLAGRAGAVAVEILGGNRIGVHR